MQYAQRHRLILAALAAAACLALVAVWLAWPRASASPAVAAAPVAAPPAVAEASTDAPAWLAEQTQALLHGYTGDRADAVSSLTWLKTTWGEYVTAVGGGGDKASAEPVYVVLARGDFKSDVGEGEALAVTTVVLTFDGASQKPATVDALHKASSFDAAALGEMRPLELPSVGS
jgi:hypothetical protein